MLRPASPAGPVHSICARRSGLTTITHPAAKKGGITSRSMLPGYQAPLLHFQVNGDGVGDVCDCSVVCAVTEI